ncbi:MAG: hypothetical protein LLG37_10170 [Spirochaetia bacterium]|nr:hypothetical protein [Spirochaetia bacterium]
MRRFITLILLLLISAGIYGMGGSVPTGLSSYFGFGAIDKADKYAESSPHFWKDGQGTACWDYSYQYLTPGWTGWVSGGEWAANELIYWESRGQKQVFTFYYTPYTLSNYTSNSYMNTYYNDFKILMQQIAAHSTGVVIVHIEPDLLGFWRKAGNSATSAVVSVASSGFNETVGGVAFSSLPNTIQGWSAALYLIRNQYAPGKCLLAHHFTHWGNANGKDIFVDTSLDQAAVNTNVDDTTTFINNVENGRKYDLIFLDPSDRDADWYRIKGGASNSRWSSPSHAMFTQGTRTWGNIAYISDRISTNLARRLMMWQMPTGNELMSNVVYGTKQRILLTGEPPLFSDF